MIEEAQGRGGAVGFLVPKGVGKRMGSENFVSTREKRSLKRYIV